MWGRLSKFSENLQELTREFVVPTEDEDEDEEEEEEEVRHEDESKRRRDVQQQQRQQINFQQQDVAKVFSLPSSSNSGSIFDGNQTFESQEKDKAAEIVNEISTNHDRVDSSSSENIVREALVDTQQQQQRRRQDNLNEEKNQHQQQQQQQQQIFTTNHQQRRDHAIYSTSNEEIEQVLQAQQMYESVEQS